jgi:hypothetical protein
MPETRRVQASMKIGFIFNAQSHQIFHSLPVAGVLARDYPEAEVTLLARSPAQQDYLQELASFYEAPNLRFQIAAPPFPYGRLGPEVTAPKTLTLIWNLRAFSRFDALVVPERTSLYLRKMGLRKTKFIHTTHGAGDDEREWDTRIRDFDLVLLPGAKRCDRLLAKGLLRPGHYAIGGYSKFDLVMRMGLARPPIFRNGRKTVLYNPHHNQAHSSWFRIGREVLEYFAHSDRFNLIFAPHIRMRDDGAIQEKELQPYRNRAHVLLDLGSPRSVDMSYSLAADIYLGDWSSQLYEFLLRPRPAIFLNPHGFDWRNREEFLWWTLGKVVADISGLDQALNTLEHWRGEYEAAQQAAFTYSFAQFGQGAPRRAAEVIMTFLREGRVEDDCA